MATVALVNAFRGLRHAVVAEDEAMLMEIANFFDQLRHKPMPATASPGERVEPRPAIVQKSFYGLPEHMPDWFVTRGFSPMRWWVDGADVDKLEGFVARLYRIGIPTFLLEYPRPSLMKLFVSLEAYIRDESMPLVESERQAYLRSLERDLVDFVVEEMAGVVMEVFRPRGLSQNGSHTNLVAVFGASGFSAAAGRWKLSLRVAFAEIAVALDTAQQVRSLLVDRLEKAWVPDRRRQELQELAAAVEPIDHPPLQEHHAAAKAPPAEAEGKARGLWDAIVDDRPLQKGAQHRMVWCDVGHRDLGLPEGRPLLPMLLLNVTSQTGCRPRLDAHRNIDKSDTDWSSLGSTHTMATIATDLNRGGPPRAVFPQGGALPVATAQQPQPRLLHSSTWTQHADARGQTFYYNSTTQESVWVLPPGAVLSQLQQPVQQSVPRQQVLPQAVQQPQHSQPTRWVMYKDSGGTAYYHNHETGQSEWHVPPGSVVCDAAAS